MKTKLFPIFAVVLITGLLLAPSSIAYAGKPKEDPTATIQVQSTLPPTVDAQETGQCKDDDHTGCSLYTQKEHLCTMNKWFKSGKPGEGWVLYSDYCPIETPSTPTPTETTPIPNPTETITPIPTVLVPSITPVPSATPIPPTCVPIEPIVPPCPIVCDVDQNQTVEQKVEQNTEQNQEQNQEQGTVVNITIPDTNKDCDNFERTNTELGNLVLIALGLFGVLSFIAGLLVIITLLLAVLLIIYIPALAIHN